MSYLRNRQSQQHGLWLQDEAMRAFEAGDYREAYPLYKEAAAAYREAFTFPGSRVFFVEATALRCLEQLLEAGHEDTLQAYAQDASRFFAEWNEDSIRQRVLWSDSDAALAFLLWRKSFQQTTPVFVSAAAAVKRGDFEAAHLILEEVIARVESDSSNPEADAIAAIGRSKLAILTAQRELRKPKGARSFSVLADAYNAAAEASRLPEGSTSRQRDRLSAFRDWFLSCSFKFQAFRILNAEAQQPNEALIEAESKLEQAITSAGAAIAASRAGDFPEVHLHYLSFWKAICAERSALLSFMLDGRDSSLQNARGAWQDAVREAEWFATRGASASVFPNRFYSVEDLRLEEVFLSAAFHFRHQKWDQCARTLIRWQEQLPSEFRWSWRDIQVLIRLLVAKALDAFERRDEQDLVRACAKLEEVARTEPIGRTGRLLAAEVQGLAWKTPPVGDELLALLWWAFSLDAYAATYQPESELDSFLSLPERVYSWLQQSKLPSSVAEVLGARARLAGAVEATLGYVADFHLQLHDPLAPPPVGEASTLIDSISAIAATMWPKRRALPMQLAQLRDALDRLEDLSAPQAYRKEYSIVESGLEELARICPVVGQVGTTAAATGSTQRVELYPDWMLRSERTGRERLFLLPEGDSRIAPGWYYLPPAWRKGTRLSYAVNDRQPLYPVRFQPRWEQWEVEVASASLLSIEGITIDHLEEAVQLAAQSVDEDDRVHPKVGALIVKDGKVLAKAFRNQDGNGGHAELIAIQACGSPARLRGAIMVTTLEPCTNRPHTRHLPCSDLIAYYGFGRVIIGMLDPNPTIRGKGDELFRVNNIDVAYFPSKQSRKIWDLNERFVREHTKDQFEEVRFWRRGR